MTVYADASLIVSSVTDEMASVASRTWLASLGEGEWIASKWCETEVASALALKVRTGHFERERFAPLMSVIRTMFETSATMIAIDASHFDRATDLLARSDRNLRGGDALHLAIAARAGAALFTLDRRMAEAGLALNLNVHRLA